jgi:hypothetical protein
VRLADGELLLEEGAALAVVEERELRGARRGEQPL